MVETAHLTMSLAPSPKGTHEPASKRTTFTPLEGSASRLRLPPAKTVPSRTWRWNTVPSRFPVASDQAEPFQRATEPGPRSAKLRQSPPTSSVSPSEARDCTRLSGRELSTSAIGVQDDPFH